MGSARTVVSMVLAVGLPLALGTVAARRYLAPASSVVTPPEHARRQPQPSAPPAAEPKPDPAPVLAASASRTTAPTSAPTPRSRSVPPPPPPAPGGRTPCDATVSDLLAQELSVTPRYSGDTQRRAVALTFDDGPSAQNTPSVLRTLAHADTPATFFLLGERVEKMPELTARIHEAGHELANHTWSHTSLRSLFKSQIHDELCRTSNAIETAAGVRPTRFRPPFGRYPDSALPLLAALGFEIELWSVDADDWKHDDPETMARDVVQAARPGSIILLHDRESITARALPSIIGGLRARGFEIVPLADL